MPSRASEAIRDLAFFSYLKLGLIGFYMKITGVWEVAEKNGRSAVILCCIYRKAPEKGVRICKISLSGYLT